MTKRILLYGATGFSGRLIAAEAAARWGSRAHGRRPYEVVLASRDKTPLAGLADELDIDCHAFSLDDQQRVVHAISDFDLVVNAAGPFAQTAERLAKSALEAGCHYVDINGEVDVYKRLDDLRYIAENRKLALVCGAGHTATLSDLMLDDALQQLKASGLANELGTVRIAVARMKHLSRGSARTMMRMLREQVTVVRSELENKKRKLVLSYIPVGRLERSFDFGVDAPERGGSSRIASAANLIDTLTARHTAERQGVELTAVGYRLPGIRQVNQWQIDQLPDGPDSAERQANSHRVVLEIENRYREIVIDWCLATPDPYELTARLVVAVAQRVADTKKVGWQTPAAMFDQPLSALLRAQLTGPLARCRLLRRVVAAKA
jgi:short subunit dehydrogenase-like uncharacterized protein